MASMQTCSCCCGDPRRLASALIRWALGFLFLIGGIGKFTGGVDSFVHGYLVPAFAKTFLPPLLVTAFGYALPFVEVLNGVWLVIGLMRVSALVLTGATLLSLALGQMLLQQNATVANIFIYVLMAAVALSLESPRVAAAVRAPAAAAGTSPT